MRLHAYVFATALCAGMAGATFAQAPVNTGTATQRATDVSRAAADQQLAAQAPGGDAVAAGTPTVSGAPVAQTGNAPAVPAENWAPNSNLQAILQEHAVITTDDLREMRFNTAEAFIPTEFTDQPAVDPALCDAGCEAQARTAAGMGGVQDGEWAEQFQAARMDLAADREWRQAYADGMQRLHSYCVFQDQTRRAFPHGSQASQDQRDQWAQYVGEMNHALGGGVDSSAARIQQDIQQAQRKDSVRAAIMEVLAERAFSQCSANPR